MLHAVGTSALDGGVISAARSGQFTPGTESILPIGYQDGCAVVSVRLIWGREKIFTLESNRDFGPAVRKPVTDLTERVESRLRCHDKFFLWVLHVHQIY